MAIGGSPLAVPGVSAVGRDRLCVARANWWPLFAADRGGRGDEIAAAVGRRMVQASAPLMWNGTVTMLLATPMALRSSASTLPSWLTSVTTSGASS